MLSSRAADPKLLQHYNAGLTCCKAAEHRTLRNNINSYAGTEILDFISSFAIKLKPML